MPQSPRFRIRFTPETLDHLGAIESKHHRLIQRAIDEQLSRTPTRPTRNRKPLERLVDLGATWELRFGPRNRFRVFYHVVGEDVWILAVGTKEGSRLLIAGEEIQI